MDCVLCKYYIDITVKLPSVFFIFNRYIGDRDSYETDCPRLDDHVTVHRLPVVTILCYVENEDISDKYDNQTLLT